MTTYAHLHKHGVASPDAQAVAVQHELSTTLVSNIEHWAKAGLTIITIRQLAQLELGVPFLTAALKKNVRASCSPAALRCSDSMLYALFSKDLKPGTTSIRC